ncbi:MAG: UDP-N-acetylglucosamine 2-epimerase [Candidatus Muproteobacteria bacterium RBG_16_64_11]|uniref:UDP-N-acetylglucosamine 2-epimerase (non-hydrolyzing) n=1 Tax=Candidatus Muproteobacteria bacterium RBG_16_64_11 TaxID=1817758 RepID=A0A1F6TBD2_9PROT|nr:MAG: UDP-N-acetylglucosamine 2-epimerase [Candidatus Muproteobacteria bacterium RBG_16_64_11]
MNPHPRVLLCIGTRPEIIKMAPVFRALKKTTLQPLVLHTGQHDEKSLPLYRFFEMDPGDSLGLNRDRESLGHLTAVMLDYLDAVIRELSPDAILVQGDTTSALSAALIAFYNKIPIGHVEAGLRSHNAYNPFPEEKNRELIARLSHWHFAPTEQSVINLKSEGIDERRIFQVGNTVVDAAQWGLEHLDRYFDDPAVKTVLPLERLDALDTSRLILITAHRRENWQGPIAEVAEGVKRVLRAHKDVIILWPVHPNPSVQQTVRNAMQGLEEDSARRLLLTPPLNYPELLWVLKKSWLTLTDSGGIQEESVTARVPVLVLRKTTERPEVLRIGAGALIGTSPVAICEWVDRLTEQPELHQQMRSLASPFGNGHSGEAIAGILEAELTASYKAAQQS